MLEKKKGVQKIYLLQIIGLLEADFDTALKFFFADQMMTIAEENGLLLDKQHGIQKDQICTYATMVKLLILECTRAKKSTIRWISSNKA